MIKNLFVILFTLFSSIIYASDDASHKSDTSASEGNHENHETKFDAGEFITHHIADAHEIHFFTLNEGTDHEKHFTIYLPVIVNTGSGLEMFSASHFYHNKHNVEVNGKHKHYFTYNDLVLFEEQIYKASGIEGIQFDEAGKITNQSLTDFSPTKSVIGLFLTGIILLLLFGSAAKKYKSRPNTAPKGLQNLLEPLVIFVRDDIAIPSIGKEHGHRFTPFLLTTFFFIWLANILGLVPFFGGFNIMGTLGVTLVLATLVFIITTINGKAYYWSHIFWPHGVPLPIKFILVPIEIVQIFMKPLVLMIRLTANITAGHIIILAFTCLVFIFGQQNVGAGYGVGVGSVLFMIFMYFIELLVVFLQAYVFTLLTALYFGAALEKPHH
ncbi:MAG: F0F1 ATP synthase subunit A [Flavobacteriales bacterium]|nr:F0F1 ATP synthase subunit A [Flavobacteriales bacterium]